MNPDLIQSGIRWAMSVVSGYLIGKGASAADVANLTTSILTISAGVVSFIPLAWGLWQNTHRQKIASVNAIDGVKVVSQNAPVPTVTQAPVK